MQYLIIFVPVLKVIQCHLIHLLQSVLLCDVVQILVRIQQQYFQHRKTSEHLNFGETESHFSRLDEYVTAQNLNIDK